MNKDSKARTFEPALTFIICICDLLYENLTYDAKFKF